MIQSVMYTFHNSSYKKMYVCINVSITLRPPPPVPLCVTIRFSVTKFKEFTAFAPVLFSINKNIGFSSFNTKYA